MRATRTRLLKRFARRLAKANSGNATLMVALGMPMLIGGAGLGVDVAQWYMWKRELQFAVDQAAVAGGWARTQTATQATYVTRATQEYNANLATTSSFASTPAVSLANYNGGTNNSVVVTASATQSLPFSSFLTHRGTTIRVSAQVLVTTGTTYTACMLALDPHASGAFTLGGNAHGDAQCGFGAISDSDTAMVKNGNPSAKAGYLVSAGGVDSGFAPANGVIHANISGLENPFDQLTPPDSPTARTYVCPPVSAGTTTTTADVTTRTQVTYSYKTGSNSNNWSDYSNPDAQPNSDVSSGPVNQTVANNSTAGTTTQTSHTATRISGHGQSSIWEIKDSTVTTTLANLVSTVSGGSDGIARPQPGTYSSIDISCTTQFAPGVYVVQGDLDFGQNNAVTGTDVMFILESSNGMHINSNSNIALTGISAATLTGTYGMSADDAAKLAGMIIYDPDSDDQMQINGNADVAFNGILYMPHRSVVFNGTANVAGACMMIAAGTITFTGDNDLGSFCVASGLTGMNIGGSTASVKIVA